MGTMIGRSDGPIELALLREFYVMINDIKDEIIDSLSEKSEACKTNV